MRIFFILGLGLLINVVYTALTVDSAAFGTFKHFPLICVIALAGMIVLPWLTNSIRLQIWLRFLGNRERFSDVFRITLAAEMVSALTPTAVGGGYAKLGWMITRGLAPGAATSVMILGSLEDLAFFALALPPLMLFSSSVRDTLSVDKLWHFLQQRELISMRGVALFFLGMFALSLVAGIAWKLLPGSLKNRVRGFLEKVKYQIGLARQTLRLMVVRGGWRFFITVSLAGFHWACRLSILTVLLAGLHQQVDPFEFFASQWLVFTLLNLVPSPGATGGAEVAFVLFYRSLVPENLMGLLVGAWRVLTFTLPVGLATLLFLALMRWKAGLDRNWLGLKKAVSA
jgi:hypothetical protein